MKSELFALTLLPICFVLAVSAVFLAGCDKYEYKCINGTVHRKLGDDVWIRSNMHGSPCVNGSGQ